MLHQHTRAVVLSGIVWGPLGVTPTTLGLCSNVARRQLLPPFFLWSRPICCSWGGRGGDSLPNLGPRGLLRWQRETREQAAQVDTGFGADEARRTLGPLGGCPFAVLLHSSWGAERGQGQGAAVSRTVPAGSRQELDGPPTSE